MKTPAHKTITRRRKAATSKRPVTPRTTAVSEENSATTTASAPMPPQPLRRATIEDLRALSDEDRRKIIDFVASGVPMSVLRRNIETGYGFLLDDESVVIEFYREEASKHWDYTIKTASVDADSMINILRHSGLDFSEALLKALGQQAFRMITQRELDHKQVEKFTRLLLLARGQDNTRMRTRETLALQRDKMERQFRSQLDKAFDAIADEIKSHPEVHQYFALFRTKLREAIATQGKSNSNATPENSGSEISALKFEIPSSS